MDEITLRLVFTAVGFGFGLVLGWTSRAARDARAVRTLVMDNGDTPATRWRLRKPTRTDVVMLLLIGITLLATFTSWRTDARVDRTTARVDQMATCSATVLSELLQATNERTTYTEESARRNAELQQAQRAMVTVILDPRTNRQDRVDALARYADALDAFQVVQAKAAEQRQQFPYPTQDQIERCR